MTTPSDAARPTPISHSAAVGAFRRALRDMLILNGVLLVVGVGVGFAVAGSKGVWGALIGVALAVIFSGTTVVSVLRTADSTPTQTGAVIMIAWFGKVIVVVAALAVLSRFDFYDRIVLGVVLLAGVLGSAYLDLRAVQRARIPYIEPRPSPAPDGGPDQADA